MRRLIFGLLGVLLVLPSSTAFAQGASTPSPSGSPSPVASTGLFLLTQEQVPSGLVTIQDGERTLDDVASGFSDPEATIDQFVEWGWQRNVVRAFHLPEDVDAGPGQIDGIYMSVHEFGSPQAAADALDYSIEVHAAGADFEELPDVQLGDYSRALYGEMSYGDEVTLYVQQGNMLIRLSAASPEGDPTEEATELMQTALDSQTTPNATPTAA